MPERNGGAELQAEWLSRERMTELMRTIREKIEAAERAKAKETPPRPLASGAIYPVEEEEQRAKLREQAAALLEQEGHESK